MQVIIYSTSSCAACQTLTSWLEKVGVSYDKRVTDTDPAIMAEFMSVNDGMIGVPFSIVTDDAGDQVKISGFDQSAFKRALHIG